MSYDHLRSQFLKYFTQHQHQVVASSSLVPAEDPTLLFTNAGMNQFKDVFLGIEQRGYTKAATAQRCVRAGGKHNDLENVGYTARHHTFFEMLGNFSFGDYFKQEAIELAYDFIHKELGLPQEKLWVTVHYQDDEAFDLWKNVIKMPEHKIIRCGDKDNFWAMGDTGPCGPCSEIFYDMGEDVAGGPPGSPDQEGDRFKEIWNLVFMQFHRNKEGVLSPLPAPCVDTGMGLERLASVIEGVASNYDTSLFKALKKEMAKDTPLTPNEVALNVLADHLRACCFLIADGITPSADGRGYVLRRIMRRALRYGYKMGHKQAFFHRYVPVLVNLMGEAYPNLVAAQDRIQSVMITEQEQFFETLSSGMKYIDLHLQRGGHLDGATLFKLYDTYGFPIDISLDVAKEQNINCNREEFDRLLEIRKQESRAANSFTFTVEANELPAEASEFVRNVVELEARIQLILPLKDQDNLSWVCLDRTPFYAEGGGQVGDTGSLIQGEVRVRVIDTKKVHHQILMIVQDAHLLKKDQKVISQLDADRRENIAKHHSATHLLHAVLREVLGDHIAQKGSLVTDQKLRFDFTHPKPLTKQEIDQIEKICQMRIQQELAVTTHILPKDEAISKGAIAFFEDKYTDTVRMLSIGDSFSKELCGGTHVDKLSDLGVFLIQSEEGISAGVRRLEAVVADSALKFIREQRSLIQDVSAILQTKPAELTLAAQKLQDKHETCSQALIRMYQKERTQLVQQAKIDAVGEQQFLSVLLSSVHHPYLKEASDLVRNRLSNGIGLIACAQGERLSLVLTCSSELAKQGRLKKLFDALQSEFDLKGGGKPELIQAGMHLTETRTFSTLERKIHELLAAQI